jgi:hypothetical protein
VNPKYWKRFFRTWWNGETVVNRMALDIFGSIWIQSISSRAFLLELEPSSPKRIEVQMICAESGQTNLGDLDYEEAGSAVSVAHVSAFWWVVPAHALK